MFGRAKRIWLVALLRQWVWPRGSGLYAGDGTAITRVDVFEFVAIIEKTGSLRALYERFPASRPQLVAALAHVGFEFDGLLLQQMRKNLSDQQLARLHRADPKWIAEKRERFGLPPCQGRPTLRYTDEAIVAAYKRHHNNCSAAARELGIDRGTFHSCHQKILARRSGNNRG